MKRSPNVRSRPGPIRVIVPLIAALTLAGCAQGEPLPIQSSPAPSFGVVASNAGRTGSPTAPTPGLVGPGAPALIRPGAFATSVVDALRVRTLPLIAPESRRLEPLLPRDATLFVLAGPVAASGYTWFQVVPVASRSLPNGWISAPSRDGERWIEPTEFRCPAAPTDFRTLARLLPGVGLACFSRVPITVRARVVECGCDVDGPPILPDWFSSTSGSPVLLVDVGETRPPAGSGDWFFLHLDPDAKLNADLALGAIVEVTGIFDHPSARACTETDDGQPTASLQCRLTFAVTKLTTVGP